MLLYARADQRSAALRQYRECVRVLDQELGVEPLDETTALYHQILNRAPLPERQVRLVEVIPAPVLGEGRAVDSPASPGQPAQDPGAPIPPLIGRDGELRDLMEAWKSLREDGLLLALEGEAGIGKSRLAAEFLDAVQARGARVIQARCYSGESGLAYAPFVQAFSAALAQPEAAARLQALPPGVLAEVGRLLPDAALRPAMPATPAAGGPASMGAPVTSGAGEIVPAGAVRLTDTGASAQARFFEALRHALQALLEGQTPGVLFLDDVHWIDSASRSLLIYLAHRLHGLPVLVLTAWRDEENESTRVLVELVEDQARRLGQDGARIHLKRFGHADIAELVRASAGREVTAALADRLYSESEGLPYAAVQYLAALTGQADPERWEMPAGLRALLRSRVTGLDAAAQQILGAAAVIGRSFDFDILRDASGRSDVEIVDGLERLLKAGLVVEGSGLDVRYDFTHEKLRALIYEETSLARRRLLHRRAAEAYARSAAGMAENAGLVAYHYEQAGLGPAAAEYHRAAGERALRLFANVEAMAHFQAALAEGHPDAAWLHEAIGDLYLLRGAYPTARASYEKAASLCTPGCVSNLEHKLGNVHHRMGAWKLADSHYLASLEAAGPPDAGSAFHVHLYTDRSMVALALGEAERGQDLAERALELAQASGDPGALAQAFNALGVLARARGNMRAAIQALEASLRTADSLEDPLARIAALNNLALVHGETGSLQRALELTRLALDLCRRRGDRHRQAALHNNLADLLHREGREEEAMEQLKQAVVIFTEIGQAAENAAVWNLTEW
jgi:tetratricopeptide (TPR) repeat protein